MSDETPIISKDVKLDSVVVDTVNIPVYATVNDLIASEDDTRILSCFNNGNKIRIMGNARAKHVVKPLSQAKKMWAGVAALTIEELQSVAGNEDAMKELALSDDVQSRIEQPEEVATNSSSDALEGAETTE